MTRIAYGGEEGVPRGKEKGESDVTRIRRINSELEFGPAEWGSSFLEASGGVGEARDLAGVAFRLDDVTSFVADGVEAIVGDTLTKCFTAEPPEPWNFLTRNLVTGVTLSPYMKLMWLVGVWTRYFVLFPLRLCVLVMGSLSFCVGYAATSVLFQPGSHTQRVVRKWLLRYLASVVVASWSGYVRFHGQRPEPRPNQIYVANHTSLIDVFILVKDYNFSCIGQRHGGLAGMFQDLLLTAQDHVWFDREEGRDRRAVQRLLKEHVSDGSKEPMLVFPEGTCTNSEYCIMFKKGSFDLGAKVYPIAIRYHKRFGDPFWNSQTSTFPRHLLDLMTSWAVVCDVYYLEPEEIQEGETPVQFAGRVKQEICDRTGLINVNWDGFLKRHRISPKFLEQRQKALASVILRRLNGELPRASSSSMLYGLEAHQTRQQDAGDGVMDTLGLEKLMTHRRLSNGRSENEQGISMADSSSRSTLRHRARNGARRDAISPLSTATRGAGAMTEAETASLRRRIKIRGAVRDTVRWAFGIALLVAAILVTNRFLPMSWRHAVLPAWS